MDRDARGREMYDLAASLFPLHRSITGDGLRRSLKLLEESIPLKIHEVPTGTPVFDWRIPQEWSIRDAYVMNDRGQRLIDYHQSNLHVVNYSAPIDRTMTWRELREHVYTLPEHPDWIPYRTAFFREGEWGFCTTQSNFDRLDRDPDCRLRVCIDSSLTDGSLTYGELYLPGESDEEILFSSHTCHPSLANDNLSGIVVAAQLAKQLMFRKKHRYSYRFLFVPATIGAIAWLSQNRSRLDRVKHGMVLALLGVPGKTTYKSTRCENAEIDRAVSRVLRDSQCEYEIRPFEPFGYDERQFGSPGVDLPVGCLMRTPNGEYPEYHTSADNLDLLCPHALGDSWATCLSIIEVLEANQRYVNRSPCGEPQLGQRGLYRAFGERNDRIDLQRAILWLLNLSDGSRSLLDIADRSGTRFSLLAEAAEILLEHNLLAPQSVCEPALRTGADDSLATSNSWLIPNGTVV